MKLSALLLLLALGAAQAAGAQASRVRSFEAPCPAGKPCSFSADLPEGNYKVTVRFGGVASASDTTVRAELRRLMLDAVQVPAGGSAERSFIVNVRTPRIDADRSIALKAPRETVDEAVAWDEKLTLEIGGTRPAVQGLVIEPVQVPTLFLLGDSTVADQANEPYASWGQIITAFFKPGIAVANHAESGETYRDSITRRRLDKVVSQLKPGDTVLLQFGHNDQKQQRLEGAAHGNAQTYQAEITTHVEAIRARGGQPVIVSSMERRSFDEQGRIKPSLIEYANASREIAQMLQVPFIDLNAMSKVFYEALGPERSKLAFASPAPGKIDNTHHNNYGAYVLAQLIVQGLRDAKLPVAAQVIDGLGPIDPAKPLPPESFKLAPSPNFTQQRPLGDEGNP